jgi:hemerythrin superfamily protein
MAREGFEEGQMKMLTEEGVKQNAVEALREDHRKVKELFKRFEEEGKEDVKARQRIAETAMKELHIHAALEEEIFYPAAREKISEKEAVAESLEEHHVAKVLMSELKGMDPEKEQYAAKFKVLAESVEHHIEEEESQLFPEAEKAGVNLDQVGQEMVSRRQELMQAMESASGQGREPRAGRGRRHTSAARAGKRGKSRSRR